MKIDLKKQRQVSLQQPHYGDDGHLDHRRHFWMIDWKEHGFLFCGVYVITPDNQWPAKIGISSRTGYRLATLQTSHWSVLKVAKFWLCANRAAAAKVEAESHKALRNNAGRHLLGEWFDAREGEAVTTVETVALMLGIELVTDLPRNDKFADVYAELDGKQNSAMVGPMRYQAAAAARDTTAEATYFAAGQRKFTMKPTKRFEGLR